MNAINLRIKRTRLNLGLTQQQLADSVGVKQPTIQNIESGKQLPTIDFLRALSHKHGIPYNWLLDETGTILDRNEPSSTLQQHAVLNQLKQSTASVSKPIPLIPIEAMAGWASGDMQVDDTHLTYYVVPEFADADFFIRVKGDSMQPRYNPGDIVACRYIREPRFLQWGKVYVLDTDQGALIKKVNKASEDSVLAISLNQDYAPFEIKRSDIRAFALVIGVIGFD